MSVLGGAQGLEPFKQKQSIEVIARVSNCASRGASSRAVEGDMFMGRTQYNVRKHLHRVPFHFHGPHRAGQVKYLVEHQEKGRCIFFDQGHVTAHHQSDSDDNDAPEIALDLDIRCKGIVGADFNPEDEEKGSRRPQEEGPDSQHRTWGRSRSRFP